MSSNYGLFNPLFGNEGLNMNFHQNVSNENPLLIGSNIPKTNLENINSSLNLRISIPTMSPSPLPKLQPLKSPYSPIRTNHKSSLRDKYYNSPYKCSSPKGPKEYSASPRRLERRMSRGMNDFPSVQSPRHQRQRSQSLYHNPEENTESTLLPPSSPRRRSQSIDIPFLHQSTSKGFVFCRPYFLFIQYKDEKQSLVFSGKTLEELKNAINSCFSILPVVRLVNVTSLDQLYNNAVIHLIPLEK